MKANPITDSTILHLFPCKQDRQWVCSTFKLCKAMAFPAPLLFNYWGNLQSWLTPPANQKGKRISKWIQNLKEETEKVQKVVIWYSEDIQSQLFLWLRRSVLYRFILLSATRIFVSIWKVTQFSRHGQSEAIRFNHILWFKKTNTFSNNLQYDKD